MAKQPSERRCFETCFGLLIKTKKSPTITPAATTTKMSRSDFATTTAASFFPNTHFTNHESLPSLEDAYAVFLQVYPQYAATENADKIRETEYNHLADHICLDYTGIGLFSYAQKLPSFNISYKSASLRSQLLRGNRESSGLESSMRRRIARFVNVSADDYDMVFTANRISAFKLLAESYPFDNKKRLVTVYDYESDAVNAMVESSQKRDARVMSATFAWPNLRINSTRLKKMLTGSRLSKNENGRGLFVFPLQSKISGARYSYMWMSLAQENGWHVCLDACGLGPKDMDTLGLSLLKPDFLICSFYKIFGENPSGFACLFVKKSTAPVLKASPAAKSIGIVRIVAEQYQWQEGEAASSDDDNNDGDDTTSRSFADSDGNSGFHVGETSWAQQTPEENAETTGGIECAGLDHADSLGLVHISCRQRCIINWLVIAMMKLKHPHTENSQSLVQIYGPKVKFERGATMAFNVFDWRGEKIEPTLVQKLADRSNISLSYSFLHNVSFSDKYLRERDRVMGTRINETTKKQTVEFGITVLTISLGFLAGFEQGYRLWAFIARFLDADFVEKERWRYTALNQKVVQV